MFVFRSGLDILQHGGTGGNFLDIGLIANTSKESQRAKFAQSPLGEFFGNCTGLLLDDQACLYFRSGLDILQHGGTGGNVLDIGLIENMSKESQRVKFAQSPLGGIFRKLHRTFT